MVLIVKHKINISNLKYGKLLFSAIKKKNK